jgi:MFS family permease
VRFGAPPMMAGLPRARLFVFALAYAGGVLAYLPLLTLLLPLKIQGVAGAERMGLLTACTLAGAVASSLSNIGWGWASDRGRRRRRWIAGGAVATAASYGPILLAQSPAALVAAVVVFQIAVNALLAPLMASMAEEVPDRAKGVAGGLLVLANPIGSLVTAALVGAAGLGEGARYLFVVIAFAALIAPLLATRAVLADEGPAQAPIARDRVSLARAWAARLLVQIAFVAVSVYLLYYFEGVARTSAARIAPAVGQLQAIAFVLPLPLAVVLGRWSDRRGRRAPVLVGTATLATAGLLVMAGAGGWTAAAIGYAIFAAGGTAFLALHQGTAMQMLPDPRHRGRDLGLLNLTNTVPALVGPALTWALVSAGDFRVLLLVLGGLTLAGGLLMLTVDRPLPRTAA